MSAAGDEAHLTACHFPIETPAVPDDARLLQVLASGRRNQQSDQH